MLGQEQVQAMGGRDGGEGDVGVLAAGGGAPELETRPEKGE